MKEIVKQKIKDIYVFINRHKLWILCLFLTLAPIIFFYSLWNMLYNPMYYTAYFIPGLFGTFVFIPFLLFTINRIFLKNSVVEICSAVLGIIWAILIFIMLAAHLSKLVYFTIEVLPYLLILLIIIALVVFVKRESFDKKTKLILASVIGFVIICTFVFGVFNLQPVFFDTKASVYMVEDEYQICWSTSTTTAGYIEIGNEKYYDSYAGALNCSTLHKVTIPREVLDNNNNYTVVSYGVSHNRAYYPIRTSTVSKDYTFRPVNFDDGIQIYNISDNHLYRTGPQRAASYFGDKLDILIANGDHLNDVSEDWQIKNMYRLVGNITNGSVPVILSRGNHEAVGSQLVNLPIWYASRDNTFYYTARVGSIAFIVLDVGNLDKDIRTVAKDVGDYEQYRKDEAKWVKSIKDSGVFDDPSIKYRIAVCHEAFPIAIKKFGGEPFKEILNYLEDMNIDFMMCGHSHTTKYFAPGEIATSKDSKVRGKNIASFPLVLGSLRNDENMRFETLFGYQFTGTAIEINDDDIEIMFTNSLGEIKEYHKL